MQTEEQPRETDNKEDIRRAAALEVIGTFVLVYFGGWSIQWNYTRLVDIVSAALSQGLSLALLVYIAHPISQAHFNPVVSLVATITGHLKLKQLLVYFLSQCLGSLLAGLFLKLQSRELWQGEVVNQLGYPMITHNTSSIAGFFAEFLATFSYVFTLYAVYYHRRASTGTCAAVLSATYIYNILSIGHMTGCSINPLRVFGPSLFGMGFFKARGEWIYYTAPVVGGVLGGLAYHALFAEEEPSESHQREARNVKED